MMLDQVKSSPTSPSIPKSMKMFANSLIIVTQAIVSCLAGIAVFLGEVDPSNTKIKFLSTPPNTSRTTKDVDDRLYSSTFLFKSLHVKFFFVKYGGLMNGFGQGIYMILRHYNPGMEALMFNLIAITCVGMRIWCFKTLKQSFTYKLKTHEDQKLITTGPYKYLAHPSYTAMICSTLCLLGALMGPYNALLDGISNQPFSDSFWLTTIRLDNPRSIFLAFNLFMALYSSILTSSVIFFIRIPSEEAMMREHFGKHYDEFLRKRWHVIPFLY
ncbi:uncharacterized protein FA14DRAFT_185877 [Meira miltonrushii]|uniref:Protein-S-isoprenylcysteine O-methyltransferase n=1 Tax=Meira miltonrushii TaxID=1280837 RepID=A0A316V2X1_9BASI|nr:uncharacterized protein FA14DRAFT_185877 [Meira miltonrushii]PWN31907.1 hypothetical protein FA14DRAFT_185877 [Meira miltonrushii]